MILPVRWCGTGIPILSLILKLTLTLTLTKAYKYDLEFLWFAMALREFHEFVILAQT